MRVVDRLTAQHTDVTAIIDDLWRLKMPLEGHGIGHVNVYALRSDSGMLLIDCGWARPGCLDHLSGMLVSIGARLEDVSDVVLTHVHADHCGLAGEIRRRTGARVAMHAADAVQLPMRYVDQRAYAEETATWARDAGAPKYAQVAALRQLADLQGRFAEMAAPDVLLEDGMAVTHGRFRLVPIHTPGHTPGHLCFYEQTEDLLFTGDTIMPRINYSATFRPLGCRDPLGDYAKSLRVLDELRAGLALPGHQEIFHSPSRRAQQLLRHHTDRSAMILHHLAHDGSSAWELSSTLSRRRSWTDLPVNAQLSATGETMAHLVRLALVGKVAQNPRTRRWHRVDDPGESSPISQIFTSD